MPKRSEPRYKAPDGQQRQPTANDDLPWRPHRAGWSWTKAVAALLLCTAGTFPLLWLFEAATSPYRIFFEERPTGVTLDGKAQALDSANGFGLSRFAFGEHRLRYVEAGGQAREVVFHAGPADGDGPMAISARRVSGVPKGEFAGR